MSEHGSGTTGPRIIHVVDCKGDPLDWRQVTLYLDTVQLLGSGSDYRLPVKPTSSSKLLVRSPPNSISFEAVDMGGFKADTLTCQVGLPGMLLYPTRPLVIMPQTSILRTTTGGLVFDSGSLHVVNGPAFPTEWRVVTNKREKRTLLLHMPSRSGHTCP